jgi:enoyl-CoA hydratase/carnithine racemase
MAIGTGTPIFEISDSIAHIHFQSGSTDSAPGELLALERNIGQIESEPGLIAAIFSGLGGHRPGPERNQVISLLAAGFESLLDAVESISIPTLCVLEGDVCGAALDLAVCCDFRIGVRGTCASLPSATLGIHHHPGGLRRLVNKIGQAATMKLLLADQTMGDDEMLRTGLIDDLVDRSQVQAKVDTYLTSIANCNADVVRGMKKHIQQSAVFRLDEAGARHEHLRSLRPAFR